MQPISVPFKDFGDGVTCPPGLVILQAHVDPTEIDDLLKDNFSRALRKKVAKEHSLNGTTVINSRSGYWAIIIATEKYWSPTRILSHEIYHLVRQLITLDRRPFFLRRLWPWENTVLIDKFKGEEFEAHLYDELFGVIYRKLITEYPQWFDPRERWDRETD